MSDFEFFDLSDLDYCDLPQTHQSPYLQLPLKRLPSHHKDEYQLIPGTEAYKRARKRRQNRESAARSRARKRVGFSNLESQLQKMQDLNQRLKLENAALKSENEILKNQLDFYRGKVKNGVPETKKVKTGPSWLVGTIALTIMCVILLTQTEVSESRSAYGRRMQFLESGGGSISYMFVGVLLVGMFSAIRAIKYFEGRVIKI